MGTPAPDGPDPATGRIGERGSLTVDGPFAIVPEGVIDSPVSDTALRLYCVLTRYGNTSGHRMPSRATLAALLRKSTDPIDRALRELQQHSALTVEHRHEGTRSSPTGTTSSRLPPGTRTWAHAPATDRNERVAARVQPPRPTTTRPHQPRPRRASELR